MFCSRIFNFQSPSTKSICRYLSTVESNKLLDSKLKLILAEHELLKYSSTNNAPENLSKTDLQYLMSIFETKKCKISWLDISYKKRFEIFKKLKILETFDGRQKLFMPFVGCETEKLSVRKQITMIPFLQNIVFDISFDHYMSSLECKNLAEQLIRIINRNKREFSKYSSDFSSMFNLHLTDLNSSKTTIQFLNLHFPEQNRCNFPNVFLHRESFMQLFPKDRIVYLSPHATETITKIDPYSVYIIGGIVDRREIIELTVPKCKHFGLKNMRLPITDNSKLVKSLDDVIRIIHCMKHNIATS